MSGGVEEGTMEGDMDLSFAKDASAATMTPAEEAEKTQWEQEHHRHRNSESLEAKEVEKEEGEATQTDRGEENTDRLRAPSASAPFLVTSNPTQLAIFFDGAIRVYDDIPLEKAQAILLVASAIADAARTASPVLATTPSLQSSSASPQNQKQLLANTGSSICMLQAGYGCALVYFLTELPLARRNSLQRFLEKRHDRLVSRAPYPPIKSLDSPVSGTGSECSTPDELC